MVKASKVLHIKIHLACLRLKRARGAELCVMVYVILVDGRDCARITLMVFLRRQVLICYRKVSCNELNYQGPVAVN